MKNKFYFDRNYGLFLGILTDNLPHRHNALQISVSDKDLMTLTVGDESKIRSSFYINSNITHQLFSKDLQLTILINPISRIGHYFYLKYYGKDAVELEDKISRQLIDILNKFELKENTFTYLCSDLEKILEEFACNCEQDLHVGDDRIVRAIKYLDENSERVISLEEIAEQCHLSTSRFLHLFREKTNLNFRRYQLWNRLIKSLPSLTQTSITATAHQFGFTDSSHYTRTFKETFGVTPKFLIHKE